MDAIDISIIIPVYNVEKYIKDTLLSAVSQNVKNCSIEIICVDDGSTDDSLKIINSLSNDIANIDIIIVQQENLGQSVARNRGIDRARGNYIYFLDSDDLLVHNSLSFLLKIIKSENLDLLFFDGKTFYDNENLAKKYDSFKDRYSSKQTVNGVFSGPELYHQMITLGIYRASPCLQLVRRAHLISNEIYFVEGIIHEDNIFTFTNILKSKRATHCNKEFFLRRVRENSTMTNPINYKNFEGYLTAHTMMYSFFNSHNFDRHVQSSIVKELNITRGFVIATYNKMNQSEKNKITGMDEKIKYYWFANIYPIYNTNKVNVVNKKMSYVKKIVFSLRRIGLIGTLRKIINKLKQKG